MLPIRTYRLVFRVFCCALFWVSCKDSRCLKSTGPETTGVRDLQPFTKLNLYDKIDVRLVKSTTGVNRATITCGSNLLPYIATSQDGQELTIENRNTCNFLRSYKKRITVVLEYTSLERINFVGAGRISSDDTLRQSYFYIESEGGSGDVDVLLRTDSARFTMHTGNTNIKVAGKSTASFFYSGGTCIVNAQDLVSTLCFCNNSGSGDFYVNAVSYLFADISQQGSIFYRGHPSTVDREGSGTGELRNF